MFRPNRITDKNIYSFLLMRNRHEEVAEIPVAYVESINFSMGQFVSEPTSVSFRIPSVLQREGKKVDQHLFHMIKEKMQIIMDINGKKYTLEIGNTDETETKDYTVKTFTAYEIHKRLEKVDCVLSTGSIVTRQLYKPQDERVEVSPGMLNLFEEQCVGWKVGSITDKARKELIMCSTTNTVFLQKIDKVVTDEIFNENVSIDIGNKPLNLKLNMFCKVYDSEGNLYIDSTLPFQFKSLPYAINNIQARYVSTSKNFYGVEFTINHTNGYTTKEEFAFVNCKNLRMVADISIEYELGDLQEQWTTKYRTFESSGTNWKSMLDNIAKSFDCIFIIDSYNQTINACHYSEFGEETGITLLYDNAIKETTRNRSLDDLATRMWVESANTTIASVNVLGTDYIECYDYFKDNDIMSIELSQALDNYELLLEQKDLEFNQLILQKYESDQNVTLLTSQSKALENRISGEKAILTAYIKNATEDTTFKDKQYQQQLKVEELEKEKADTDTRLNEAKANSESLSQSITQIGIDIKKENAVYNGQKLFNDSLLLELSDYLIEQALEDDTHLTAYSLYSYASEQIKNYQKPNVDFSISSSMEFLKRAGVPVTDCLFIGAKMVVEDRAGIIDSEDGSVLLYQFTLDPNTNVVSNFKFTNNAKAPDTPLKAISRTTQTTKATKSLADFYKATWADIKDKTVDIEKVLTEGLDLAAQKVRSRSEENVIDMSEAGIFLIDAQNNNEQLALINDLITMTTDGWRTSKVAISPEGVIADTLIGRAVLSKELYISNENVSFKIEGDGLKVKDTYGTEKIFMGLTDQKPHLRVGQTNGNYLEWKDDSLTINASSIKLGSQSVATGNDVSNAVNGAIQNVQAGFEMKYNEIRSYVDDKANLIQAGVDVKVGQVRTYVDDRANNLQASINVQAGLISQKVDKNGVIGQINNSGEQIQISANKISLEGAVSIGTGGRKVKIDNADYTVLDGNTRKGFFGFRSVSYDNYVIPRFSMGNSGTSGANEYFAINPYKGNGENPQNYKYSYVDIAYHSMQYNTSGGGDWSNIKMYADGVMRLSPLKKLEITSNFSKGSYGGTGERLVAEFRTDNHTWYNGNISTGAIVNRTNGNGLILIDQHDHLGRQSGVRVQCNDDGGKSFRALDDGGTYCGTSNYRWKAIYSVKGTISTSDERYKIKTGELNTQDCYNMVKNIPLYNYYMMNKKVEDLTEEEINEQLSQDNAQIGLMAQDLADYKCGHAILDYDEESDIYNVKQAQLSQALLGALQKQIEITEQIQKVVEDMKEEINILKEKQNGTK